MTDPRTTVELAEALRDAAWFPFHPADQGPGGPSQRDLEIIAWAASEQLLIRGWQPDYLGNMFCWHDFDSLTSDGYAQDPAWLRATLLAAIAAKEVT